MCLSVAPFNKHQYFCKKLCINVFCKPNWSVIYMQSNKVHEVFQWVSLFSTYVSSTCFGPHRSIVRSVLYKLYSQICYVVLLFVLLDTSSRNGWTCRVVRVLPHTKVCEYSLYKTVLMMDRWGPKHVELTYVLNKLTHWNTFCILLDCIY